MQVGPCDAVVSASAIPRTPLPSRPHWYRPKHRVALVPNSGRRVGIQSFISLVHWRNIRWKTCIRISEFWGDSGGIDRGPVLVLGNLSWLALILAREITLKACLYAWSSWPLARIGYSQFAGREISIPGDLVTESRSNGCHTSRNDVRR
jgi:hypothetical protein